MAVADRFYIVLFFVFEWVTTVRTLFTITLFFFNACCLNIHQKWYNYSAILCLLHGWCQWTCCCLGACVHHRNMHQFTVSFIPILIRRVLVCFLLPILLAEWPVSFSRYCGKQEGGTVTEIGVSTKRWPWRRKLYRRLCQDSNPRPFDHESGALTTEPSPLTTSLPIFIKLWHNYVHGTRALFSLSLSVFFFFFFLFSSRVSIRSEKPIIMHSGRANQTEVVLAAKLQALVYDILPPSTAILDYAIGLEKPSANEQIFVGARRAVRFLLVLEGQYICNRQLRLNQAFLLKPPTLLTPAQIKTKSSESRRDFFF